MAALLPPEETAQSIIEDALEVAGIVGLGQSPGAEDLNKNFRRLNDMLAQWQRKRWLIWHLVDSSFTSTGALYYTIGRGAQFDVAIRPDRVESAFVRQLINQPPSQVDYPVRLIEARETYNQIRLKQLNSAIAWYLFYDSDFPVGKLYFWPLPQASLYEMHVSLKAVLSQFTSLVTKVTIPPEYVPAMKWGLARRIRAAYRRPLDPEINALEKDALNTLRMANAQVALLRMPAVLSGGGVYDPYSDSAH